MADIDFTIDGAEPSGQESTETEEVGSTEESTSYDGQDDTGADEREESDSDLQDEGGEDTDNTDDEGESEGEAETDGLDEDTLLEIGDEEVRLGDLIEARKQLNELSGWAQRLQDDPFQALVALAGADKVAEDIEKFLQTRFNEAQMSDEEKKVKEYEKRVAELEAREKELQQQQAQEYYTQFLKTEMPKAFEAYNVPDTTLARKLFATEIYQLTEQGHELNERMVDHAAKVVAKDLAPATKKAVKSRKKLPPKPGGRGAVKSATSEEPDVPVNDPFALFRG